MISQIAIFRYLLYNILRTLSIRNDLIHKFMHISEQIYGKCMCSDMCINCIKAFNCIKAVVVYDTRRDSNNRQLFLPLKITTIV